MPDKTNGNFFWPDVSTREGAKKAAGYGVWAAGIVAFMTAAFSTWALVNASTVLGFIDAWAYLDAVLFAAIAFGIHKESRVAGVAGLVLFVLEKVYQVYATGSMHGSVLAVVMLACFISGVRGVFALHRIPADDPASTDATIA